jgi:hypothetical protein
VLASETSVPTGLTDGRPRVVVLVDAVAEQRDAILAPVVGCKVAGSTSQGVAAGLAGVVAGGADSTASVVVPIDTSAVGDGGSVVC